MYSRPSGPSSTCEPTSTTTRLAPAMASRASVKLPRLGAGCYRSWPAMPSRTAAALASPRVRTSSLRRIAETWWATVLSERKSCSAMSAFRSPCATSARTSSSRARQVGGVLLCSGARSSRQPAGAALAQAARDDRRRRPSAQSLQLLQGTAKGLVVVGVRERERGLVGTAELCPELRRAPPLAGDLEGVRLGRTGRNLLLDAGAPAPVGELSDQPADSRLLGELEQRLGRLCHALGPTLEPGGLGSRRRDRRQVARALPIALPARAPRRAAPTVPGLRAAPAGARASRAR